MRSLFFQDHCGVLDVFQTCLTVFTPFSPGACGRNRRFLERGDSLPGGGCHPARAPYVCLRWPPCPQLPLDVVEGGPLFTLVWHGFGHAVSAWGAWGYPVESVASSSKLLTWEPGEGLHLKDRQSFLQMRSCPKPLSSRPGLSFVGTGSWTYFPLCTLCFRTETAWCMQGIRRTLLGWATRPCGWTSGLVVLVAQSPSAASAVDKSMRLGAVLRSSSPSDVIGRVFSTSASCRGVSRDAE